MVTRHVLAAALVLATLPGCALVWLAEDASGSGDVCPAPQRNTCYEALRQGGSVCGTGAAADGYQALVQCACTGDAPCAADCGMQLCAGEAVAFSGDESCVSCLQFKCSYGACSTH